MLHIHIPLFQLALEKTHSAASHRVHALVSKRFDSRGLQDPRLATVLICWFLRLLLGGHHHRQHRRHRGGEAGEILRDRRTVSSKEACD